MLALAEVINTIKAVSKRDQRWLVKRLSIPYPELDGYLSGKKVIESKTNYPMPDWSEQLKLAPARIIASVLLSGQYEWQQKFLVGCENTVEIEEQLADSLSRTCHELLAKIWFEKQSLTFECLLIQEPVNDNKDGL